MSAHGMLCAMAAGSALVVWGASRARPAEPVAPPPVPSHEAPWLTRAAADAIVGDGGNLGPLFAGVELGGPAPAPAVRQRIADFARANHVDIRLEIANGALSAVRFEVTFGGCCGYEGADVLALRLGRPRTQSCCACTATWVDDWTVTSADTGVHMRARVRVNRVAVRWERVATFPQLLERADALVGRDAMVVADAARDRWRALEPGRQFLLEIPYPFDPSPVFVEGQQLADRNDLGVCVTVDRGRIGEVTFTLRPRGAVLLDDLAAALRARWGRPRVRDDAWTWRTADRIVTADLDDWSTRITIRAR